jgi:hypothetical protein
MLLFHDISHTDCIRGEGKPHQPTGYLRKSRFNKVHYAHRLAYEDVNGTIPEGYHIHHLCDNKLCVNAEHLVALSPSDHLRVHSIPKARVYYDNLTTCKKGHPLDGQDKIQRYCLTCKKEIAKIYQSREDIKQKYRERYLLRKELANVLY